MAWVREMKKIKGPLVDGNMQLMEHGLDLLLMYLWIDILIVAWIIDVKLWLWGIV